jgi:hypothetical protein
MEAEVCTKRVAVASTAEEVTPTQRRFLDSRRNYVNGLEGSGKKQWGVRDSNT